MTGPSPPSRDSLLFLQLVMGLQQSGMMALGKLTNPVTHKTEVQLGVARDVIDTLATLESRTQGRLDSDEARVLRQALTDLRLNYVEELKKSSASAAPAEG
jgi:hypothetical protein